MSTDRVEKHIDLRAPRSRVWRAIANPKDFGAWFGSQEAVTESLEQTRGWTDFCCGLKAYLEHGINLRRLERATHD